MARRTPLPPPNEVRLRRLIRSGYFPAELPPQFTTSSFAKEAVDLSKLWNGQDIRKFWTTPEHYSIPRFGQTRRKLSIVNPINQLHVAHLIVEHWDDILTRLQRSEITEFRPRVIGKKYARAVPGVNFDGVSRRRAEILARFGRYVKTDIARFYPSIYTHSIAWALLGKNWVKENIGTNAFKNSYANHLDKAVAAGQMGQTIGIPIGPDTSRIISELIATDLEEIAREQLSDLSLRAVRYVDDMLIGLNEPETPDVVLSKWSAALYEYELELNGEKTTVHGMGYPHAPEWIHFIRTFDISIHKTRQREDLDSFFEQAFHLADANLRDNVLLYAAKRAASFEIAHKNWNHLIHWLLYAARRSTTCVSFVVEFLSTASADGKQLPLEEIVQFIHQQLPIRGEAAHTSEVSWLMFLARELKIPLKSSALGKVLQLRSGTCALIVFEMLQRGLVDGRINTKFWRSFATSGGLKSEMWLVAYEITKKGWWPRRKSCDYITSDPFFAELWKRNVEFYDPRHKARPPATRPIFARPSNVSIDGGGAYPG